jgi:hypothetical protein
METTTGRINVLIADMLDEQAEKRVVMDLGTRNEVNVYSVSAGTSLKQTFAGIAQFHDPCRIATVSPFGKTD